MSGVVCWCVVVVKSVGRSGRDEVSSSSSDYEDPDEPEQSQGVADDDDDDDDGDDYENVTDRTSPTDFTTDAAAAADDDDDDEDDLIYECCDELTAPSAERPDDYANLFYCRWDNLASDDCELSFRRGDLVKVVSRQYDEFGWWVGSLNDSVGLVPRDYLTPAYQLVN